jgi:hypothetical protein
VRAKGVGLKGSGLAVLGVGVSGVGIHQPSGLDQILDFLTSNLRVVGVGSDPDDLYCKSQFMGVQPHSLCEKINFWGIREKVVNCLFGPSERASGCRASGCGGTRQKSESQME